MSCLFPMRHQRKQNDTRCQVRSLLLLGGFWMSGIFLDSNICFIAQEDYQYVPVRNRVGCSFSIKSLQSVC